MNIQDSFSFRIDWFDLHAEIMDLEGIVLSEISQTEKDKKRKTNTVYHFYVESKKNNKLMNIIKKK